jgi:hypothetical protein
VAAAVRTVYVGLEELVVVALSGGVKGGRGGKCRRCLLLYIGLDTESGF